jgi:hypothetical protein
LQVGEEDGPLGPCLAAGQGFTLAQQHFAEQTGVRTDLCLCRCIQGFVAPEQDLLFATELAGEYLETVGGTVGHHGILCAFTGLIQQAPLRVATVHAEGVVQEERYRPLSGLHRAAFAGQVGLREGQYQTGQGEQASQEHQPMLHLLPSTRLLRDLRQEPNVRKVDALEAPKLEEVDEHRDRQGGKGPEECRV